MRELKFSDPDALRARIEKYFNACIAADKLPTWTGLALALDTNRMSLDRYVADAIAGAGKRAKCGEALVWAKASIEAEYESVLVNSEYSKVRGVEIVLRQYYKGWESKETSVSVKGEIEHKGEVRTAASSLTDEELMRQLAILQAKAAEIQKREGADGMDGGGTGDA